jgi:hypothetical protein
MAHHAQVTHTVLNYKGSWFTPAVGYIVASCLFAIAAYALVTAFRGSNSALFKARLL